MYGTVTGLFGVPRDRGCAFRASQQENWTAAVRPGIRARIAILSLRGMHLFRCWEPAQVLGVMAISSYRGHRCAARLLAVPVVTEPERGVSHRGQAISAVRWFVVAGRHAGIGSGRGIAANERVGL